MLLGLKISCCFALEKVPISLILSVNWSLFLGMVGPYRYRAYNWRHCFLVGRPQQVLTVRDGITSKKVVSILMIPTGDNKQVLGPWLQSANRGQDSFLCISTE